MKSERSDDPEPLQTLVMTQAHTIQQLQAKLAAMETKFENELTALRNAQAQKTSHLEARLTKQETKVAFNVRLDTSSVGREFTGTETLLFDAVDLNLGNGYDKHTGIFTAPVAGVYEFTFKITHTPPGALHVELVKNGREVAEAEGSGDDPKYPDRASSTVVLQLKVGDEMWVRRMAGDSTHIQGSFRTSFAGILVTPDHP
nr:hypothetical protein BaRGS_022247 [Batillaria attramentaria]